ncbi:MAG: hypothetical protein WAO74_06565 [Polaribacter sp.]|uniref:hypothetical protein n=1 Tax=Polaribacter sp. TaxID=1920175 RepID=UPI003BB1FC60
MIKTSVKALFIFLFLSQILNSQESAFSKNLKELSEKIQTVQNSKKTFTQSFSSEYPGVIKYSLSETDSKGKTEDILYEFNVADIDVNTIKPVTSKDLIQVQLIVDKNQKMIKEVVNSEKISFLNKIMLYAKDIDNARELTSLLKESVPICEEITKNRLSLNSYEDRLKWLANNVVNVNLIDKTYAQSLLINETVIGNVKIVSTIANGKSVEYELNLANINSNALFFESNGSEFVLKLETKRRLNTIKVFEDGVQKNYDDRMEIQCSSVENARDLQKVIQDIIPLAEEKFNASFPKITSTNQGLEYINKKINTVIEDELTTQQAFTTNCVTNFTKIEESTKKKEDFLYDFNLIDLNKEDVEIDIKGTSIYLVLNTIAKNKFIKLVENDELQNFTNSFNFTLNSIEDALYAKNIMETVIELCNEEYKKKPQIASKTKGINTLIENLKSVQIEKLTYEQKIERIDKNDDVAIRFTNVEVSDKSSEKNVQEFNLTDINPKSVTIEISGKKVIVEFTTNYQEKIIKTYQDGEIKSYTNKVAIYCDTIENAREIKALFMYITEK